MSATSSSNGGKEEGFVVTSDEGDPYYWLGSLTLNKVQGRATLGGLDIVDHRVPAGYAPPLHVHRGQDEIFYVVEGLFIIRCGDRTWQAGPGALAFLPRDVLHGFAVSDDGPGRTLLINAPAGFADLIHDLGDPAARLELPGPDVPMPDPERVKALSEPTASTAPNSPDHGRSMNVNWSACAVVRGG